MSYKRKGRKPAKRSVDECSVMTRLDTTNNTATSYGSESEAPAHPGVTPCALESWLGRTRLDLKLDRIGQFYADVEKEMAVGMPPEKAARVNYELSQDELDDPTTARRLEKRHRKVNPSYFQKEAREAEMRSKETSKATIATMASAKCHGGYQDCCNAGSSDPLAIEYMQKVADGVFNGEERVLSTQNDNEWTSDDTQSQEL